MTVIAIPGGTGGLGRTLVAGFKGHEKHTVLIFSRKHSAELESQLGVPIVAVDYSSVEALLRTLEEHKIEAVISALATDTGTIGDELNLIKAADQSSSVKRFVPSQWGIPVTEKYIEQMPYAKAKLVSLQTLEKTSLEYTSFHIGYFLDYYGMPKIPTYMSPYPFVLDAANNEAAIPDSGDVPIVFNYSHDVAKYVVAALDLDKWERDFYIASNKMTWNEGVKLIEEVKGVKFKVTYDSLSDLKEGKITELTCYQEMYKHAPKEFLNTYIAAFGQFCAQGFFDFTGKPTLNEVFPSIQTLSARELLEMAWK